ncbi:MAG: hypothetical protein MJ074_07710 [Oscillospiraceae bacterium]|nr:hypothetical protein [Oscillospiraceae bacterium]
MMVWHKGVPERSGIYYVRGHWGSGKPDEGECWYSIYDGYFRTAWNFTVDEWRHLSEVGKE